MTHSLRLRLLVGTSLGIALILTLLGSAIYFSVHRALLSEFDRSLLVKARALTSMAEQNGGRIKFEFDSEQMPEFVESHRPEYFEAWFADGKPLLRSQSLADTHLAKPSPARDVPEYRDLILPDGRRGRSINLWFVPRDENDGETRPWPPSNLPRTRAAALTVARERESLDRAMGHLRWLLFGLCGAAIFVSGGVLLFVVTRSMKPVAWLAWQIGSMTETDLSRRVDGRGAPSELMPVVARINGLLELLGVAFSREKAFSAAVAHELRTPLASLRTTLEVCRSKRREHPAYEAMIDKCLGISGRMEGMVQTLLLLTRADCGEVKAERKMMDLCLLMEECWALFHERSARRQVRVDWSVPESCLVLNDADKLRMVLNNLFDNAVTNVDAGGLIDICATRTGDRVEMLVRNSGSRINPDDASRVFERFWRGDAARSDDGLHCGLGLSLCQRLMPLLGGELQVETKSGFFMVRLSLRSHSDSHQARDALHCSKG